MKQQTTLTKIDEYYNYVSSTPIAMFNDSSVLDELNNIDREDLKALSHADLPTSLHNLLMLARNVSTLSEADKYLSCIKDILSNVENIAAHIYYTLNYLYIYLKLNKRGTDNTQYQLFALCLLCFDYDRCLT